MLQGRQLTKHVLFFFFLSLHNFLNDQLVSLLDQDYYYHSLKHQNKVHVFSREKVVWREGTYVCGAVWFGH